MPDSLVVFVGCLCALLATAYVWLTRNFHYWRKLGVPELKPSFPFGSVSQCLLLRRSIHEFLQDTYRSAGTEKMIGFHVLDRPYLMLREPELLKSVFIKDFNLFTNKLISNNQSDPFGKHTLFLVASPPWKRIRQTLSPMFTSGKLRKHFELAMEIYKDLEVHLASLGVNDKSPSPVEVREVCARLMADIIGITAYNLHFNSLKETDNPFSNLGRAFTRSVLLRYFQFGAILFVPQFRPLARGRFFDVGTEFFKKTFEKVVEERKRSGDRKGDFVDLIIDMIKEEEADHSGGDKVGRDAWMTQLSGIFIAGFETSSTTTSFGLYHVALHQDIQKKLRTEMQEITEATNGKLTYDAVTKAPYLNMVVRETLRMHPILTWVDRTPDVDYTFPGTNVTIQKGVPVIFPIHAIHMDPKYYPNPEQFQPERFSDENKDDIIPFTYSPFSEGPRNCIGGRLGLLQVKLALAYLVQNYEITPCEKTTIPLGISKLNVLMGPDTDVHLNFKKISS